MIVPSAEQQVGAESYETYATKMAQKYGLDPSIFVSMLKIESGLNQTKNGAILTGSAGELGIGQLKPSTAAEVGVNPYNAYENIEGSAKYLKKQLDATGDYALALAAYNQGLAGSRGSGRSAGLKYAERVLQLRADNSAYEKNTFEKLFSEGGALREGGFFSGLAQNAGVVAIGVGILFIALIMTGKNTVTNTVSNTLKGAIK